MDFSLRFRKRRKRKVAYRKWHEAIWIFFFLNFFINRFSFFTLFFLKEAVRQRAFCSYIVIFLQRKILYKLIFLFPSQNSKRRNITCNTLLLLFPVVWSWDFQCRAREKAFDPRCVRPLAPRKPTGRPDRLNNLALTVERALNFSRIHLQSQSVLVFLILERWFSGESGFLFFSLSFVFLCFSTRPIAEAKNKNKN